MESWIRTSLILCVLGFLFEFRPLEAYYTQYVVGHWKNITEEAVNQRIYPLVTYSQVGVLILVFLLTDLLRYKPMIFLMGVMLCLCNILTFVGTDVFAFQACAVLYGIYMAAMVAYFTYIYAKVDKKHYQKVTSHTQVAILLGRFLSSVVGQVVITTGVMDYHGLNYINLPVGFAAFLWCFLLPPVERSIYFHSDDPPDGAGGANGKEATAFLPPSMSQPPVLTFRGKCGKALHHLWDDFKYAYTNIYVLKWSIWWALSTCGYYQIIMYMQVLWETVITEGPGETSEMQGMVYAVYTSIGAVASFACGWLRLNWAVLGELTLAGCALIQGASLIMAAHATVLMPAYVGYVAFTVLYHTMITIVNAEIAKHIHEDSYGLIFGVNNFFALVFQAILTIVVAGEGGLTLTPRQQFVVYGSCFVLLGGVFLVIGVVMLCQGRLKGQPLWIPEEPQKLQTTEQK